jgi:hypothetical protein
MNFNTDDLELNLSQPVNRGALIKAISMAKIIPLPARGALFIWIAGMTQDNLNNIGKLFSQVKDYITNQDLPGLETFLIQCNIPVEHVEIIKRYAANLVKV